MNMRDESQYKKIENGTFTSRKNKLVQEIQIEKEVEAAIDPRYNEIFLPSNFVPYENNSIRVRKFVPADVAKIYKAKVEENPFYLIDAIGATIVGLDIQSLTVGDFYFLLYWHRLNSYTQSPLTISWTSRYGNINSNEVRFSELEIKSLEITKQDYQVYKDQGLDFPRVRDFLYIYDKYSDGKNEEEKWLYSKAQFLSAETCDDKLKFLQESQDLSIIEDIREWEKISDHRVIEKVSVTDAHFNAEKAFEHLKQQAIVFAMIVAQDPTNDNVNLFRVKADEFDKEAREIEAKLAEGHHVHPRKEEVALDIDATSFFPGI